MRARGAALVVLCSTVLAGALIGQPPAGFGGRGDQDPRGQRQGDPLLPGELEFEDGTARVDDRETFERLSYQGQQVMIDTHLAGLEFVKFQIEGADEDEQHLYFINTETHRSHPGFMRRVGISMGRGGFGGPGGGGRSMRGVLVYRPMLTAPDGSTGYYTFEFEPNDAYPYAKIKLAFDLLGEHSNLMRGKLGYRPLPRAMDQYEQDKAAYEQAGLPVCLEEDLFGDLAYLPLNAAVSFGVLRLMEPGERPSAREIAIYRHLPNEMPRVAGVLTGERQTPLSHVNLRAIQDKVANAYVRGIAEDPMVAKLLGRTVRLEVAADGYELREASTAEVEAHLEHLRPDAPQHPPRDLDERRIRPLAELGFEDSVRFGAKAANVAVLGSLDLPEGMVPGGFAVPFAFYHEFMQQTGLYDAARSMMAREGFAGDAAIRETALANLRAQIEQAEMPAELAAALAEVQAAFPAGTHIRCRSSTNNEDLEGFSGAGLYDSFTHRPDEGHLANSVRQVYASLWNFRAFEERAFYRIDHFEAAMGVLLHPNYEAETANGVAVTDDILYQTSGQRGRRFYVNVQVGEDLVTNPEAASVPEELLLGPTSSRVDAKMRSSNRVADGEEILDDARRNELRKALWTIHKAFRKLYGKATRKDFAIEVEFKITADGVLAIKQARPWVN